MNEIILRAMWVSEASVASHTRSMMHRAMKAISMFRAVLSVARRFLLNLFSHATENVATMYLHSRFVPPNAMDCPIEVASHLFVSPHWNRIRSVAAFCRSRVSIS